MAGASDGRRRFSCVFLGCSEEDYQTASRFVKAADITLRHAASLGEADFLLRVEDSLVLLAEEAFSGGNWRNALAMIVRRHQNVALVVATASADEGARLEMLERGAYDAILRPFVADELVRTLQNADAHARRGAPTGKVRTAGGR
jgi:DNA-binding response OmpR family regulator